MPRSKRTIRKTVKAPTLVKKVEDITLEPSSFHETFPFTLKHLKSDDKKVCYFQCKEHMEKYIERSGLKKKEYAVEETKEKEKEE
jgi:hypothetical protein